MSTFYQVKPGPDRRREHAVSYYKYTPKFMEKNFGRRPARMTVYKYLLRGYPIARGGPYIRMPVFFALKRPMTTVEAMNRFVTLVRLMERRHGIRGISNDPE